MKRAYQVMGFVLLLLALLMGWESLSLQFYTEIGPGPGFFPFWISVLLTPLSVILIYNATFGESDPMPDDFIPPRSGWVRLGAIVGSLLGVVFLMEPLGFRFSIFGFLLFLLLALGRQKLLTAVILAAIFSWSTFYAFVDLLHVPLPIGRLGY